MQRILTPIVFGLLGLSLTSPATAQETRKPNIIFILADDLGWTDVACFGSKYYETPNIDRLAAQGIKFTNGYTCGPNCQPTRACLLSGQYGPRTGVYTVGSTDRFDTSSRPLVPVPNVTALPLEKITVAEALKKAGYATGMFGKWHLGNDESHHPAKQGFDEAISSAGQHFNFKTSPPVETKPGEYLADFLTDRAVDFIDRHKAEPFFLYLPHFGVHSPHEAKEELIARFKDKPKAGGHNSPIYAAMIASVDESVGRVLAKLEELKLAENTLVIYSSDNGGVGGYAAAGVMKNPGITDNSPLRGGKGMLYEGGVRVPYIMRWAGKIPPGGTSEEPILSVDLYPTLLEVAGARPPADHVLDGESWLANAISGGKTRLKRDAIFWHFPGYLGASEGNWRTTPVSAIRMGDYKLLEFFEDKHIELYNLRADISQKNDLAKTEPETASKLHGRLKQWREEINAPIPQPRREGDTAPKAGQKKKGKGKGKGKKAKAADQ